MVSIFEFGWQSRFSVVGATWYMWNPMPQRWEACSPDFVLGYAEHVLSFA
jgi:hypothetical protein